MIQIDKDKLLHTIEAPLIVLPTSCGETIKSPMFKKQLSEFLKQTNSTKSRE